MELNTGTLATYMLASFLSHSEPLEVPINDYFCMLEVVTHEAGGEPLEGKQAVAAVVMNRVDRTRHETVCDVVHARNQFSYEKGVLFEVRNDIDRKSWLEVLQVSYDAVQGTLQDPTQGADHYFNPRTAKRYSWMNAGRHKGMIGNHEFRQLISDDGVWM